MKIQSMNIDTSFWGYLKCLVYIIGVAIGASLDYIGVEKILVYTLTGLMMADWVTGVLKSWKLGYTITSKRSNKGIIGKLCLLVIPIAIAITLKAINIPIGITIRGCFTLLLIAELYSLLGNCYCIYTGEDEKEWDAVSAVLKYIRNTIFSLLKRIMKEKE